MNWIFLSPHFDDVALSCGGIVWERVRAGDNVSVWTICAGNPPHREYSTYARSLHERWETGIQAVCQRRAEDQASCKVMGASYRYFNIPDCIYRPRRKTIPHYYTSDLDIFGKVHPAEKKSLVSRLSRIFSQEIPPGTRVVCPLTLGNHVDHQITRIAAERVAKQTGYALLYYADYPYVKYFPESTDAYRAMGWESICFEITEQGLAAWCAAIAAHRSQISTFWATEEELRTDILAYSQTANGRCLWKAP